MEEAILYYCRTALNDDSDNAGNIRSRAIDSHDSVVAFFFLQGLSGNHELSSVCRHFVFYRYPWRHKLFIVPIAKRNQIAVDEEMVNSDVGMLLFIFANNRIIHTAFLLMNVER